MRGEGEGGGKCGRRRVGEGRGDGGRETGGDEVGTGRGGEDGRGGGGGREGGGEGTREGEAGYQRGGVLRPTYRGDGMKGLLWKRPYPYFSSVDKQVESLPLTSPHSPDRDPSDSGLALPAALFLFINR